MNTIKDSYYKRFDADFFPTKEQWESYSNEEREEILRETKTDLLDEKDFLLFYEGKNEIWAEKEKAVTLKQIELLTEKYNYLISLGENNYAENI